LKISPILISQASSEIVIVTRGLWGTFDQAIHVFPTVFLKEVKYGGGGFENPFPVCLRILDNQVVVIANNAHCIEIILLTEIDIYVHHILERTSVDIDLNDFNTICTIDVNSTNDNLSESNR
jgi:hypothetical protein